MLLIDLEGNETGRQNNFRIVDHFTKSNRKIIANDITRHLSILTSVWENSKERI
jgi:hypothetical protein